jgi:hypothetical protein
MRIAGGAVIDWLVLTRPLATPMEYYGEFWHAGQMSSKDRMRQIFIETTLRDKAREMVIIWAKDGVVDVPSAKSIVRKKIGVNK